MINQGQPIILIFSYRSVGETVVKTEQKCLFSSLQGARNIA